MRGQKSADEVRKVMRDHGYEDQAHSDDFLYDNSQSMSQHPDYNSEHSYKGTMLQEPDEPEDRDE